jgi:hypothetical protein
MRDSGIPEERPSGCRFTIPRPLKMRTAGEFVTHICQPEEHPPLETVREVIKETPSYSNRTPTRRLGE